MKEILHNINFIILDLGGVVLNIDYDLTAINFEKLGVPNFKDNFSKKAQNTFFDEFETGKASANEFREEIRKVNCDLSDDLIDDTWNSMLLDLPMERIELIEQLKLNYKVYLLSNTNAIHVDAFLKIADPISPNKNFRGLFDSCYFSNEIGLRKPNVDTFKFVLEENNLEANKTLFIDDSPQHIEGAKKLGVKTYLLKVDQEDIVTLLGN